MFSAVLTSRTVPRSFISLPWMVNSRFPPDVSITVGEMLFSTGDCMILLKLYTPDVDRPPVVRTMDAVSVLPTAAGTGHRATVCATQHTVHGRLTLFSWHTQGGATKTLRA